MSVFSSFDFEEHDEEMQEEWESHIPADPNNLSGGSPSLTLGDYDAYDSDFGMTDLGLAESLEMEDNF